MGGQCHLLHPMRFPGSGSECEGWVRIDDDVRPVDVFGAPEGDSWYGCGSGGGEKEGLASNEWSRKLPYLLLRQHFWRQYDTKTPWPALQRPHGEEGNRVIETQVLRPQSERRHIDDEVSGGAGTGTGVSISQIYLLALSEIHALFNAILKHVVEEYNCRGTAMRLSVRSFGLLNEQGLS
ncbi:hypothetical protein B0H14DRAFT_2564752 [Mycena olivaceomarginata]|nr:hypothetical protein B0H14DRAFT_2564752 [Mycena olivaceomarginata]